MRLAAASITRAELDNLRAISASMTKAVARRDMVSILNTDRAFHEQISLASRNPILAELLNVLQARSQRFWALSMSSESHLREVLGEHDGIVRALAHGDGEAAAAAVVLHIESFRASLLQRSGTP